MRYAVRKLTINGGGYTSEGEYFGAGKPVYRAYSPENDELATIRANDRAHALELFARIVPEAQANNGSFYVEGRGWCRG